MAPGLSVVMAAHNEAENLPALLADIRRDLAPLCGRLEVVVADDGSTDATAQVLAALGSQYPELQVVALPRQVGYAHAARAALAAAREERVLFTDADRQFALDDAASCLAVLEGCDLVTGYRAPRRDPALRVLLGRTWTGLVNLLFGYTARDVNCAFKLVRRPALEVVLPQLRCRGAAFSAEWLVRARRAGQRLAEVPVRHLPRRAGRATGGRPAVVLGGLAELLRLRLDLGR